MSPSRLRCNLDERKKFKIPDKIAPAVIEIIAPIIDELNAGGLQVDTSGSDESTYGHAMRGLAQAAFGLGEHQSEEEQLQLLRKRAQMLLKTYGPSIIEKMDPKLVEALRIGL